MKGFSISLDSVIALAFVMLAVIIIATQIYNPRTPDRIYLKELTIDTATVLDKTGAIDSMIDGNLTEARGILEATPTLACMNINVVNATGKLVATASKSGCNLENDLDLQITMTPFIYEYSRYTIKIESWFRTRTE
jgi:hypothetical protein